MAIALILLIMCGCEKHEFSNIPEYINGLENVTVYSASISSMQAAMNLDLVHDLNFGNTDSTYFGAIRKIAVDERGRIFVLDYQKYGIHVFQPNGEYLLFLGGEGSGPGEFRGGSSMRIISNNLFVYDSRMRRVTAFDLDSLLYSEVKSVRPLKQDFIEKATGKTYQSIGDVLVRKDGTLMVEFYPLVITSPSDPKYNLEDVRYSQFYILDYQGNILSENLFKLRNRVLIPANVDGQRRFNAAQIYEFLGKPLIANSDDDYIYTAWTEDFLIKIFNPEGEYQHAFYYPHEKKILERDEAIQNVLDSGGGDYYLGWIENVDLPETWPALNYMLIDDENRLWVSTIVEDFDIYEWWVLEETGELITKFEWPRNEPIEVIKNGKMYTRQTDVETGLQQVVRYRVEME